MGAWGHAAWDNDDAADWFGDLFAATKLAQQVEKTLKTKDLEEYAGRIRAAAYLLVTLGRVYIWPADDLDRHLKLAIEKLEAISALDDYQGDTEIEAEIAELKARLQVKTDPIAAAKAKGDQALQDLGHADADVRYRTARWIGDQARGDGFWLLANKKATEALIKTLRDTDERVVEEAVVALNHTTSRFFADARAYDAVLPLLQSKRPLTRISAVGTAANAGGEKSLPHILPLLKDGVGGVRLAAVRAVGSLTHVSTKPWAPDQSLPLCGAASAEGMRQIMSALIPRLRDKNMEVRDQAASLLGNFGDEDVLAALEKAVRGEREKHARASTKEAIEMLKKRIQKT